MGSCVKASKSSPSFCTLGSSTRQCQPTMSTQSSPGNSSTENTQWNKQHGQTHVWRTFWSGVCQKVGLSPLPCNFLPILCVCTHAGGVGGGGGRDTQQKQIPLKNCRAQFHVRRIKEGEKGQDHLTRQQQKGVAILRKTHQTLGDVRRWNNELTCLDC